jgi:hypothetical protein
MRGHIPAGSTELVPRTRHVEVGDADHMHSARAAHLGEEHGAELAGADQPNGHRTAGGGAFHELGVKIHALMVSLRAQRSNLSRSGQVEASQIAWSHAPHRRAMPRPAPGDDQIADGIVYWQSARVT